MLSIAITTLFRGLSNRENIVAFTAPERSHKWGNSFKFLLRSPFLVSRRHHQQRARTQERSIRLRKPYNLKQTIIPWPAQRSVIRLCGLL